jgi:hypothetical protein
MKKYFSIITAFLLIAPVKLALAQSTIVNPLGKDYSVAEIIGNVLNIVLGVTGSIALLMVIYGGYFWLTAAGVPDKVNKGKSILIWATLGLIVVFGSFAITSFVLDSVYAQ